MGGWADVSPLRSRARVHVLCLDILLEALTLEGVKDGKVRVGIKSGLSGILQSTGPEKMEVCYPISRISPVYTHGHCVVII